MQNLKKLYKNKLITYLIIIFFLSVLFLLFFEGNIYADEFDSKEVAQKMYDCGAYDVWQENKSEYPYYLFSDYSIFNTDTTHLPPGTKHRSYSLFLFDQKPLDGFDLVDEQALSYKLKFTNSIKFKSYSHSDTDGMIFHSSGGGVTEITVNTPPLIGTNFNITNSDGSYFFGLTSLNPTLTTSSIKRTLLKPMVYLIPLLVGLVVLVVAFRKAWIMLKTLLAGV